MISSSDESILDDEIAQLHPREGLTSRKLFLAVFILQTIINFDSGVVPASLGSMQRTLRMTFFSEGLLGAIVYVGLSGSSLFAGHIFHRFDCKFVLVCSTTLNGIACILFALSPDSATIIILRFFVGVSQAFPVIYAPIWVDQFAPASRKTFWMSLMYICSPLGIMLGFGAGIIFVDRKASPEIFWARWRIPLIIQGSLLLSMGFLMSLVPKQLVDKRLDIEPPETMSAPALVQWQHLKEIRRASCEERLESLALFTAHTTKGESPWRILLKVPLFCWTVLNLSILFFVVTGIQFWITGFLVVEIGAPRHLVGLAFIVVSATAPTSGVLFGGWIIDRSGGYNGAKQTLKTLKIDSIFGAVAICSCIAIIFMNTLLPIMVFVWILLFSGGAIVPSLTGIIVSSVDSKLTSFASSFSQLAFNILGFAMSTLVSGAVMEITGSFAWGFRTVLLWSLCGIFTTWMAIRAAQNKVKIEQNRESWSDNPTREEYLQTPSVKKYMIEKKKVYVKTSPDHSANERSYEDEELPDQSIVEPEDATL